MLLVSFPTVRPPAVNCKERVEIVKLNKLQLTLEKQSHHKERAEIVREKKAHDMWTIEKLPSKNKDWSGEETYSAAKKKKKKVKRI